MLSTETKIKIVNRKLALEEEAGVTNAHWLDHPDNFQLKVALETARDARTQIAPEQHRLKELLTEAESKGDPVEISAREYQIWYIEKYLTRAADIAEKRLEHFRLIKTQTDFDEENERCAEDKTYWFEFYAFGYDPRARTPLAIVPFELFPKQAQLVEWLDETIFYRRTSGIVEKSRDEGATELFVRWCIHNWRYTDSFSALLSTRKEDEIDTKKKQGTLFERARMQIRLLPMWMLPNEFDREKGLLPDKLITNPDNKNAISGEAPVERIGSGDRVTVALFDEHAFWRFGGYPQYRSMSQTTDSIISVSSVGGKLNQFADIAYDGVTRKFVLDWRENPFKDKRWYDSLPYGFIAPKMSRTTVAQEVDRDYDASQPGKVWKYDEIYIFITQSEFLRPFKEAGLEYKFFDSQGNFRIPPDWRPTETSDYGQTEGHEWSYALYAQPTANYPVSDSHFCFVNVNLEPTGLTTSQAVEQWRKLQIEYGIRDSEIGGGYLNKPRSYNSHEQKDLREVLLGTHGENWEPWKTDYQTGIEQIQDWWTPVDVDKPNPFRPEINGRCRLVFVAPDGEYTLAKNERLDTYFVTVSATERGFFTARKQFSAYHYPESELGKAVKAMRPVKEEDDIVDNARGYAIMWNVQPKQMTPEEKFSRELESKGLAHEQIEQIEDEATRKARIQRRVIEERAYVQKKEGNKNRPRFMRIGRR